MKYLSKRKLKGKKYVWDFRPPRDAVKAGVAHFKTFRDFRIAKREVPPMLDAISQWRDGRISGGITSRSTLNQVIARYLSTKHFLSKANNTKIAYKRGLESLAETALRTMRLGDIKLKNLNPMLCQEAYEKWLEVSPSNAATKSRLFSVVMSYCISLDLIYRNPMSKIKKVAPVPKSITWSKDQVEKFVTTAFKNFRHRSVGLIILLSYTYCQRPIDIINLKWSDVDFENDSLSITQSKREVTVELPISEDIKHLLLEQKKDFDFQPFIAPYLGQDKSWKAVPRSRLSPLVKEVLAEAGLPKHLSPGYLRKTGIQELVDVNVDITAIMSVTGHKSTKSLSPYVKPQLSTARMALEKRKDNV